MTMLPIEPGQPGFQMDPIFSQQLNIPKPNKGGMFGGGKWKQALAMGLAGLVSRRNPALLQGLMAMQMQKQRDAQEAAQYQQRREDSFSDWQRRQEYEAAHPSPVNNDTVNDYNFRVQTLGKEAADDWLRNPPQYMNVPGVGLVQMPRATSLGGSAPPQQAIDYLKANPNLKADFDSKYGPGAADRILGTGGQSGGSSAGEFPRPF